MPDRHTARTTKINLWKRHISYQFYIHHIPKHLRNPSIDPSTPRIRTDIPNRLFNSKWNAWRRAINNRIKYFTQEEKMDEINRTYAYIW